MKIKSPFYLFTPVFLLLSIQTGMAQGPMGRSFGIGISLGEPTAVTARFWENRMNSWDIAVGASHLGNPHIHADYLWHFPDAFRSRLFGIYIGVGAVAGFGKKGEWFFIKSKGDVKERWYYGDDKFLLGAKAVFGVNLIPRNTPLDIFIELDPVLGIIPGFGFDIQPAIGIRFYP